MVATSARAWAPSMSAVDISPTSTWVEGADNGAPQPHRQAWTERNPAASVSAAKRGQRLVGVARSACMTGLPLR